MAVQFLIKKHTHTTFKHTQAYSSYFFQEQWLRGILFTSHISICILKLYVFFMLLKEGEGLSKRELRSWSPKHCGLVKSRQDMTPCQRQRTPHLVYIFSNAHTPLIFWPPPLQLKPPLVSDDQKKRKKEKRLGPQKTFVVAPQQIKADLIRAVFENDVYRNTEMDWEFTENA